MNDDKLIQVWVLWLENPWVTVKDISSKLRLSKSKVRQAIALLGKHANTERIVK